MDGVNLKKTNIKAFTYNAKEPVTFQRKFEATIKTKKRVAVAIFYMAHGQTPDSGNLISATTAQDLGLLSQCVNNLRPLDCLLGFEKRYQKWPNYESVCSGS